MLFARALLAFLLLPAIVGGLVPWWIVSADPHRGGGWPIVGTIVALAGLGVLLRCVRDFYVAGRGTLAPWDPPRGLVVVGGYRHVRNPMYIGVLGVVLGWSLAAGSPPLAAYAAVLALGFHLRTVLYEEPTLERLFGDDWRRYRDAVPRWLPRRHAWVP